MGTMQAEPRQNSQLPRNNNNINNDNNSNNNNNNYYYNNNDNGNGLNRMKISIG